MPAPEFPFKNTDLYQIWDTIANPDPVTGLATEATLQVVNDNVFTIVGQQKNLTGELSVFKDPGDDLSWLGKLNTKLDITLTAQANLIKQGFSLQDLYVQLGNIGVYTNRPNNRQATAYQTAYFIGNFATPVLAVAGVNAWLVGAGTQLVGTGFQYVYTLAGTVDVYAITATGF